MEQPSGFQLGQTMVCKLCKVIYELKQTPRAWYDRLSMFLGTMNFQTSKGDSSLKVRSSPHFCCYILIYVDDIIILGSSTTEVDHILICHMIAQFA